MSDYFSKIFLPTLREKPAKADTVAHGLMLRAGLIHLETSGIYTFLPLGLKVLQKVMVIIQDEMHKIHCTQISMPLLQSGILWEQSGRYNDYGPEMLRMKDRHDRTLLFSPTNEELITFLMKDYVSSYRDFPKSVYQIQWKFRDELRPRAGLLRSREFLMKDAYTFDLNEAAALHSYRLMFKAYLTIFQRIGLHAFPVTAESGAIGGNFTHEFIVLADSGETKIYAHQSIFDLQVEQNISDDLLIEYVEKWKSPYAVTQDMYTESDYLAIPESERFEGRGIEVGQLFYFGTKYTYPLDLRVNDRDGNKLYLHMGSYGIGVSRIIAAIVDVFHDEKGIVWPYAMAPYHIAIIPFSGDEFVMNTAKMLYESLDKKGYTVLLDDRDERPGRKLNDADLLGFPFQLRIGKKELQDGCVLLVHRKDYTQITLPIESVINYAFSEVK